MIIRTREARTPSRRTLPNQTKGLYYPNVLSFHGLGLLLLVRMKLLLTMRGQGNSAVIWCSALS